MVFIKVDLPTFGLPTIEIYPQNFLLMIDLSC